MPIRVTDISWEETVEEVAVSVPLKGVSAKKADIFSSDLYIKVNFPPYLVELDLLEAVDARASTAVVGNGLVRFTLAKRQQRLWNALQWKGTKEETAARRLAAREAEQAAAEGREAAKREAKEDARKLAVSKQLQLEQDQRQGAQAAKDAEIAKANEALDEIAAREAEQQRRRIQADTQPAKRPSPGAAGSSLPPVRTTAKLTVAFTKREFSTPMRESSKAEEDEWLEKQKAARRAVNEAKMAEPGSVDHDPLWYKDRGSGFFKKGDFKSAIQAFTSAITLDASSPSLYSNRAACHLKLGDAYACAQDSTKALSLLMPPCESNLKSRLRAFCRRGAALSLIEDFDSALDDYRQALLLSPDNEALQRDIAALEDKLAS